MKNIVIGLVAAFFGFVSVGALTGGGGGIKDYAAASEEDQQKYLENVAKGFKTGFKLTAGKTAEITGTKAMAEYDLVSVDIVMKSDKYLNAKPQQIEAYRKYMYKNTCKMLGKQKMFESGITMKIRMKKETGGSFANFKFDKEVCSRYGA